MYYADEYVARNESKRIHRTMNTTEHIIKVQIPVGYKPAPGVQPRKPKAGELILVVSIDGSVGVYTCSYDYDEEYRVILVKDQQYIDTSTIAYKLEVVRQYMLGKQIQTWDDIKERWIDATYPPSNWISHENKNIKVRVRPEGVCRDGFGPYYVDEEGRTIPVPE